ncbi:MAG: hypothetical protein KC621_23905 [Myxococcales bacterium]|nr:hypothetical protein [Myxococcales bacterium]
MSAAAIHGPREIRSCPLTGVEVVLASARRVERAPPRPPEPDPSECPFCPGNEAATPPTIATRGGGGAWVARAFPNRAPALVVEQRPDRHREGPFERLAGTGAHEVVVCCPEHRALHELPAERSIDALLLARERILDLRRDPRLRVLQWFRNQGLGGSASQPHPHAQIVGLPFVPDRIRRLGARASEHRLRTGASLLQRVVEAESREGRRVVAEQGDLVALCPFAPAFPFEVWIAPRRPAGHWVDEGEEGVASLATLARDLEARMAAVLGDVPTRQALVGTAEGGEGGWWLRLAPHLASAGGLELATDTTVHGVFPEEAATALRGVQRP